MMAYSRTDPTMMRDPLGVKLSVVTPVPNRLHLRVSFLFIAIPCKAEYFNETHMYDAHATNLCLWSKPILMSERHYSVMHSILSAFSSYPRVVHSCWGAKAMACLAMKVTVLPL